MMQNQQEDEIRIPHPIGESTATIEMIEWAGVTADDLEFIAATSTIEADGEKAVVIRHDLIVRLVSQLRRMGVCLGDSEEE